jgi:hypothetical protein
MSLLIWLAKGLGLALLVCALILVLYLIVCAFLTKGE